MKIVFLPTLEIVVPEEPQNGLFDIRFVYNEPMTGFTQGWVEGYFDSDYNYWYCYWWDTFSLQTENGDGTDLHCHHYTDALMVIVPIFEFEEEGQLPAVNTDDVYKCLTTVDFTAHGHSGFAAVRAVTITTEEDLPEYCRMIRFDVTISPSVK